MPRYRGRFAPSPTGALHLGSLMAAVASYLEAKVRGGDWLLRIEDLDPPRMMAGAAAGIIAVLEQYGFQWDEEPIRQSDRIDRYEAALARLMASGAVYPCSCSRKEVAAIAHAGIEGPVYPGTCRTGMAPGRPLRAWRVRVDDEPVVFPDAVQGECGQRLQSDVGDFVVRRGDGLFAYQLAVVVDDAEQGVNAVVRGADLLDSTPRQIHLQRLLGFPQPHYAHIPVLVNEAGEKLSKQTLAAPLDPDRVSETLYRVLVLLGQRPPVTLIRASAADCWDWAFSHWQLQSVPSRRQIEC
ncbi:tRNA glutamyl-Q(34) synthetase GluQRS [Chitiniphilus eburneus]|uniref:Glutamyl-Q tRNA(Asp) synthetase n=1 Tax=Chitiniphilus eburneus TaxID=2571148 RepID=A0A4U0Q1X5_9NEIS|nr:tRNA glutamyl-Q(34) synthetase GluQRS [Chitiniphilus eburneus]TJZ74012.1 tRNA glutamyl-Q(34) synthetase GluQRS [Chitiniphilus eburneus]